METTSLEQSRSGHTLVEVIIVIAIVAVVLVVAIPRLRTASENQELRDTVGAMDGALRSSRGEAIRTGDVHLMFYGTDAEGNALLGPDGQPVEAMIVNDGAPGSANQNCTIDPGEKTYPVPNLGKVTFNVPSTAITKPDGDTSAGSMTKGSTFLDPSGATVTWVMFRPEGLPVSFDSDCNLGGAGSGSGAFYMMNDERAYAVVLRAMGTSHVENFNIATGLWE